MNHRLLRPALLLLAACSAPDGPAARPPMSSPPAAPLAVVPDTAAGYAFLRQTIRLSMTDSPDVRGDGGYFFSRRPYGLGAHLADKLVPVDTASKVFVIGGFRQTPAPVLREFRQQMLRLDTALQRRLRWDPARLGRFVFVDSAGATLRPALAAQVRFVAPAERAKISQAIGEWNRSPRQDRFYSYASWPLFSADGRYVLIVRGQAQQSIGWDSLFVYVRTATGWKILDSAQITTI